ncbi:MAG: hypothetical protein QNJ88_15485 [Acidimicrobiia bacterium]|nr:hypothetical protein [Acidimicrobiia bacterium]
MTWEGLPPISTYPKARRKELFRRVGRLLTRRPQGHLLNLEEVQSQLKSFEQSYVGVRSIPIDQIVGSVARSSDFDDDFLPVSDRLETRWQSLENRFPDGGFPPIVVFKVGDAFFVADGHHRVAIAKQRKMDYLDAEITEIHTPYEIDADTDVTELVHLGQQRIFMEASGLGAVVPGARFTFTRPWRYAELLDNLKVHGWDLVASRNEFVTREEIARSWFETVYLPTIKLIRDADLPNMCEDMTIDDLFLWVGDRWRRMFHERGDQSFEDVIREAAQEESDKLSTKAKTAVNRLRDKLDPPND